MEALRLLFVERCGDDLARLRQADADGDASEIRRIAHNLAGSAGSFGWPEISRLALIVDEACRDGADEHQLPLRELIAALDGMQVFGREDRCSSADDGPAGR
jgi:HPt (histidine-containing phosphotransfer) domain-containing protein